MRDGLHFHVNQVHVSAVSPTPTFQTRDRMFCFAAGRLHSDSVGRVIASMTRHRDLRRMAVGQLPEQFRPLAAQ